MKEQLIVNIFWDSKASSPHKVIAKNTSNSKTNYNPIFLILLLATTARLRMENIPVSYHDFQILNLLHSRKWKDIQYKKYFRIKFEETSVL